MSDTGIMWQAGWQIRARTWGTENHSSTVMKHSNAKHILNKILQPLDTYDTLYIKPLNTYDTLYFNL